MEEIKLPKPVKTQKTLEHCIEKRRSVRRYDSKELSLQQLSNLLWAMQGSTDTVRGFRTAPSAGALYPLEVYVFTPDGIYHYLPHKHTLEVKEKKDRRRELAAACLGQEFVEEAPVNVVICAVPHRTTRRYGERGYRYIWIEIGHAAQNLHLEAVGLGLASVPVGAFYDAKIAEILKLSEEEIPCYVIPVGYQK